MSVTRVETPTWWLMVNRWTGEGVEVPLAEARRLNAHGGRIWYPISYCFYRKLRQPCLWCGAELKSGREQSEAAVRWWKARAQAATNTKDKVACLEVASNILDLDLRSGRRWTSVHAAARFCSDRCRLKAWREQHQGDREQLTCVVCGKALGTVRAGTRHCSNACRQRAYRARQRNQQPPTPETKP